MADLSITDTSVVPDTGFKAVSIVLGEAGTAGMPVYRLTSDQKAYKAECDNADHDDVAGILLANGGAGQVVPMMYDGDLTIGAAVTMGGLYLLSATAGKIMPASDLASTNYLTVLFFAISATKVRLMLRTTGLQKP